MQVETSEHEGVLMTAESSRRKRPTRRSKPAKPVQRAILADVRELILAARQQVAQTVNAGLTMLYWQVGDRIRREILKEKRAEYGERIVSAVSTQLVTEFGQSFSEKNLRRMVQLAEVFPDEKIVVALIRQLSWTHFLRLIPIEDPLKWREPLLLEGGKP